MVGENLYTENFEMYFVFVIILFESYSHKDGNVRFYSQFYALSKFFSIKRKAKLCGGFQFQDEYIVR